MDRKKIVIIGGGHNALVAACYLARANFEVWVFEKNKKVGGCCVTDEETFPGFKVSSASYVNSLFSSQIAEGLGLLENGYEVIRRNPSSFTPLPCGRYLMLGPDHNMNRDEISKFSIHDAEMYSCYEQALKEVSEFIGPILMMTPSNIPSRKRKDLSNLIKFLRYVLGGNPVVLARLLHLMFCSPLSYLDSWFETDVLKATLLTGSIIGAVNPNGYVLLHHEMGDAGGSRGIWGYQRGGMGNISESLAHVAKQSGVRIETEQTVRSLLLKNDRAIGIVLNNGVRVLADIVVSGVDPKQTFLKLLPDARIFRNLKKRVNNLDFSSASMKINIALSGLPSFRCMPGTLPGPQHRGTIHISPTTSYIARALGEARLGTASTRPILEITIPSVLDNTIAPVGKHLMNIFVQFTPYHIKNGSWDSFKQVYFQNHIMPTMRCYIENIDNVIESIEILSPVDLERRFGLTEGNIFHGAMNPSQLFMLRPLRGLAGYKTPVSGLYLCGAGTHPGGGVMGICGFNAAREIITAEA